MPDGPPPSVILSCGCCTPADPLADLSALALIAPTPSPADTRRAGARDEEHV